MKTVVDHLGRTVEFAFPPKRIISLCPCITETLYTLQLQNEIVGRTRYCIYPTAEVENAGIVGGTKDIDLVEIHKLKPDLIIVEKEENTEDIVATLEKHYPVYVAEVQSIDDAYRMIDDIGYLTDRAEEATRLRRVIQTAFQSLPNVNGQRAAYVIWKEPFMVVGQDTYINSVLDKLGFINVFSSLEGRYPMISMEDFQNANLDYVLLASEPYSFELKHQDEFLQMMPNTKPLLVDGEMFWYGAKMLEAATYFRQIFNEHV